MIRKSLITALAGLAVSAGGVAAQNQDDRITALQEQIDALQAQINQAKNGSANPDWLQKMDEGLSFKFYGETKWNIKNGADRADPHRFVLIPGKKLSDYAYFTTEIEIEHGGVQDTSDGSGRFDGELELEQFYVDVEMHENVTWRSLGISLIPVGTINMYHEPDQFYSVHRPIMYKYVIPSTWMETGTGFHGEVPGVEGLSYWLYLSSGISSSEATHGTDGSWNIRSTRPSLRENDGNDSLAYSARLAYQRGGFAGSVSTYISDYKNGTLASDMALYDIEASYRFENGIELIADYAFWNIENPQAMQDNFIGERIDGYRLEVAYHHSVGKNELVPFIRAEGYDTSSDGNYSSYVHAAKNAKHYLSYGAMYKFGQNWELKGAVRQSFEDDDSTEFSLGIGIQF